MTELEIFYKLKKSVLEQYQISYPYFVGNWKTFGSQDILNLIDDIQLKTKQSVSEKWIYTHLKPETNQKLPRKDMLDILCVYTENFGWDEYKFNINNGNLNNNHSFLQKLNSKSLLIIGVLVVALIGFFVFKSNKKESQKINIQNSFTKEAIDNNEVKAFVIVDSVEKQIDIKNGNIKVSEKTKVIIKSPFFEKKTVIIESKTAQQNIELNPNDYAMMLKAFMKSDIKDWETRKTQLNKILADNLEVMVMLQNNLGAEYFNKTEFSQKLIIPSVSIKRMKIVELKQDENNKISFLRITE